MANPVATPRSKFWFNNDGLMILYGTSEGTVGTVGEYMLKGTPFHFVEATITLASLPLFNATTNSDVMVLSDTVTVPNGAFLEKLEIQTFSETAGSGANLDIGLVDQNRVTEIDFDGILVAGDDFNGGTDLGVLYTYVKGTTDAGALMGTQITNTGYLTARADTADFTSGVIKVRLYYTMPLAADVA